MGQNESSFKATYQATVSQLSSVQMGEIARRFNELYAKAGGPKGHVVDREAFSNYFNLPVAVGDRLFDAFDEKKNGKISFEEFVCGLAIVLHGSFHDRCMLLFRVFNLNEDEGISRSELSMMLSHILHSTHTILHTIGEEEASIVTGEDTGETVQRIVNAAFTNCDITHTGKLLPLEFEYWLKRNPKILDSLLSFKTREKECTLGSLIMSPSEQLFSVSEQPTPPPPENQEPLVFTMKAASPTLFQVGEPSEELDSLNVNVPESEDGDEVGGGQGASGGDKSESDFSPAPERHPEVSKRSDTTPGLVQGSADSADAPCLDPLPTLDVSVGADSVAVQGDSDTSPDTVATCTSAVDLSLRQAVSGSISVGPGLESCDDVGVVSEESADQAGSIMLAESNISLSIDMSCVARSASSDKLGSPVLPTTSLEEVAMTTEELEEKNTPSSLLLATSKSLEKEAETPDDTPPTFVVEDLKRVEEELEGVHLTPSVSDSVPDVTIDLEEEAEEGEEQVFLEEEAPASLVPSLAIKETATPAESLAEIEVVPEEIVTAWLPTTETQELLSQPQPTKDPNYLTCPALVADVRMIDVVGDLLSTHFPNSERKPQLTVEQVTMDIQGLRRLVSCGCLGAALEMTARFLSAHGQGLGQVGQPTVHTHKTLQMWSARISLLMHLGLFQEAEREMVAFEELQNPDLYYQYHTLSYPNKAGSMVPFSLRLLHAQLPTYQNSMQLSLDRLCQLQTVSELILAELHHGRLPNQPHPLKSHDQQVAVSLWRRRLARVKCAMANTFAVMQDFHMAVEVYSSLLELLPEQQAEILSVIGRLYLQLGDLKQAQTYFSQVSEMSEKKEGQKSNQAIIKVNEGLVNVFLSRWQIARECFEEASKFDPSNLAIRSNITVCTFYQGKLKESIGEMEHFIRHDPPSSLQPAVFGNLAAAYELESGNSLARKLAFIPLLAAHVGDTFSITPLNIR